jgi:hypothetical protein
VGIPATLARTPARRCLWAAVLLALVAADGRAAPPEPEAARLGRLRAALAVQRTHAGTLIDRAEVVATGLGLDERGEPVIRVFTAAPGATGLPARLDGVPVRVSVSGRLHALRGATCEASGDGVCETDERWPLPAPIGVSIGHPDITAGTAGARVTNGLQHFVLSNNHVLAASNAGTPGDPLLQPGPFDGGSEAAGDGVATLHDFQPISFCIVDLITITCPTPNVMDAAIGLTTPAELGFATPGGEHGSLPGYGVPNPAIHSAYGDPTILGDEDLVALLGQAVLKHGRTSGETAGTIDAVGVTTDVCYDEYCLEVARFVDQISVPGAFSEPGDSGSLVVTDDAFHRPVGLLFAGSASQSLLNRIDVVLDRFAVTVDDGGTAPPIVDAALGDLATPSFGLVGEAATVSVTVRNAGTVPLAPFDVTLDDTTEATATTLPVPALAPFATHALDFSWTPTIEGPHDLVASTSIADDDPGNDTAAARVTAYLEPPGVSFQAWRGEARTDAWTVVTLIHDYGDDMVPICTPQYDVGGLGPLVARVRNASGSSFEVGLGRPWFGAFPGEETAATVHCIVVRAGVYDEPDLHLEAVRLDGFASVDGGGVWQGEARAYAQAYAAPVVLGQVVSAGGGLPGEIGPWSVFWARGATAFEAPGPSDLAVGRHTGEDPEPRAAETLVYLVVEAGTGTLGGRPFRAGVGPETIRGVEDGAPFPYGLAPGLPGPTHAVAASAGMDGLEGGWPILYGEDALASDVLGLAIEEDWYFDPERSHTTEQVAYLVVGSKAGCGLGAELALLLPVLGWARRRRRIRA